MADAVRKVAYLAYDSTNSAAILDFVDASGVWTIDSEGSGVLVLKQVVSGETNYFTINNGDVVLSDDQGGLGAVIPAAQFPNLYIDSSVLENVVVLGAGVATVPSLIGGASTTVSVTLSPSMPDTSYQKVAILTGGASLLATLSITSTAIVDEDTVNVTVQNTGLVTLAGATVLVMAIN